MSSGPFTPTAERAAELAARFGTPLYAYDVETIGARVAALRRAFGPSLLLRYAVKANPCAELLETLGGLVDGLDVASVGELEAGLAAGFDGASCSFAGPGKSDAETQRAVQVDAAVAVESLTEMKRLALLARRLGKRARLRLRINPLEPMHAAPLQTGGGPAPFGIDEELLPAALNILEAEREALSFEGIHVHAGSQCLSARALARSYGKTLTLAQKLAERGWPCAAINLGGGLGVASWTAGKVLGLGTLGELTKELRARHRVDGVEPRLELEPGRYLVAEAGVYLARVLEVKHSRGVCFVVVDGGMHQLLAATGVYGPTPHRPPLLCSLAADRDERPEVRCTVVGRLCTPLDRLAERASLPQPQRGDLLAWLATGAYGASASPLHFLSHRPPAEVLLEADGEARLAER